MRPMRTQLSITSMVKVIGIPRKFVGATVHDLYDNSPARKKLVEFIKSYIHNFNSNIEACKGIYMYGSNGVGKTFISSILLKEAYKRRYTCKRVSFMEYCSVYTRVWDARSLEDKETLEATLYDYKGAEFLVALCYHNCSCAVAEKLQIHSAFCHIGGPFLFSAGMARDSLQLLYTIFFAISNPR